MKPAPGSHVRTAFLYSRSAEQKTSSRPGASPMAQTACESTPQTEQSWRSIISLALKIYSESTQVRLIDANSGRMNIVYFDLETQRTANDVGGWDRKIDMGMSLGVTYSSDHNEYRIYSEKRVDDLIHQLLRADLVVGFNVVNFDYQVLMGYTILDLPHQLRTLDLLVEVENAGGIKPRLDNIAQATLGVGKSRGGFDAIQ